MTQTEINDYKGLIAQFLGFKLDKKVTWHFFKLQTEYFYILPQPYGSDDNFDSTKSYYTVDELNRSLPFDVSWTWILECWFKMQKHLGSEEGSFSKQLMGKIAANDKPSCFYILTRIYDHLKMTGVVEFELERNKL